LSGFADSDTGECGPFSREGGKDMPKFVVFIYDDEARLGGAAPDVIQSTREGHEKFAAQNGHALRGGGRLAPSTESVSVRGGTPGGSPSGERQPFLTDATHAIGGYYIIEAADTDEAVAIAGEVPAPFGGVEVRRLI
jgi:hypothetical protein